MVPHFCLQELRVVEFVRTHILSYCFSQLVRYLLACHPFFHTPADGSCCRSDVEKHAALFPAFTSVAPAFKQVGHFPLGASIWDSGMMLQEYTLVYACVTSYSCRLGTCSLCLLTHLHDLVRGLATLVDKESPGS